MNLIHKLISNGISVDKALSCVVRDDVLYIAGWYLVEEDGKTYTRYLNDKSPMVGWPSEEDLWIYLNWNKI
jgi:hypothetical protein